MNEHVLIIDDESSIRMMMQLALQHTGYRVTVANDGPSGLRAFGQGEGIDLVILDQRMPGMPGIEVMHTIFERQENAKVIIATAFGTLDLALEAIQAGAQDFLRKPFTADTLRAAVRTTLDRPVQHHMAVPVGKVCASFTRTTFNGFSFQHEDSQIPESGAGDMAYTFRVVRENEESLVTVTLPVYVQELVKAHTDSETVPGGASFWEAMSEECLANHLWHHAALPENRMLRIEDLSSGLRKWIDSMLTVSPV
jgi:DNA-binding response OmpR family regulator